MTEVRRFDEQPARRADTPGPSTRRTAPRIASRGRQRLARTVANHPLRKQIDELQSLGRHEALAFARDTVRFNLTQPGGNREVLLGTERAADALLASRRFKAGYGAMMSYAQREAVLDRDVALGQVATHGVRSGLDYATRWAKTPEAEEQVRLVREDIKTVQDQFRTEIRANAFSLLDQSRDRILRMLEGYGLMTAHATPLVTKVLMDEGELDSAVDDWIEYARRGRRDRYEDAHAVRARGDLAQHIDGLRALQTAVVDLQSAYVRQFNDAPLDEAERRQRDHLRYKAAQTGLPPIPDISPAAKALERQINDARRTLSTAWIAAERQHPVLAAHRGRERQHLEWLDLGNYTGQPQVYLDPLYMRGERWESLAQQWRIDLAGRALHKAAPAGAHERAAVREGVRKLANIDRARLAIQQGKLSPLTLAPVVHFTERQLLIAPRSAWAAAVKEVVDPEKSLAAQGLDFVKSLFDFAVLVLSVVPNPLMPAAVLYDVGRNAYVAVDEYVKYDLEEAYSNTDLDIARSLSDKIPSLTGFVMALIGAGLSAVQLKSAFEAAAAARGGLLAGEEGALAKLDEIGERYQIHGLGEDVARAEGMEARTAAAPKEPAAGTGGRAPRTRPPTEEEEALSLGKQRSRSGPRNYKPPKGSKPAGGGGRRKPTTPKRETRALVKPSAATEPRTFHASESSLRKSVAKALKRELDKARLARGPGATHGFDRIVAEVRKLDPAFADQVEQYFKALNDPKWLEEQMVYLWKQARDNERTVAEELEHALGGGKGNVNEFRNTPGLTPEEGMAEFGRALEDPRPLVDVTDAADFHGSHTHMFDEWLGDRLFKGRGKGLEFRQKLVKLGGPSTMVGPAGGQFKQPFWVELWDALFDADKLTGGLNSPEVLGEILQNHLDFPMWDPPAVP